MAEGDNNLRGLSPADPVEDAIDKVCDQFETLWQAGQEPRIEDYLGAVAENQQGPLLEELLLVELWHRRSRGQSADRRQYGGRFPGRESHIATAFTRAAGPQAQRQLGDYRLLEKLGQGGMGTVYKALHTRLERVVAVKVLPHSRAHNPEMVRRFHREMKAVGRVSHPNIVQAYDAREIEGASILVMEYVEGLDLNELIKRRGPLPVADACEVVRRVALGLQCAHEYHLVHRDVKPSNIMLTPQGQVKILDLGLARIVQQQTPGDEMTGSGQTMGTPDYIAPEQVTDSHNVDIRADIYSLGCTLFTLLTGQSPYPGPRYSSPYEKMMAHVGQPAPPIREFRKDVPQGLAEVLDRMLAKQPADRFAVPADVAAALASFAAGCHLSALVSAPGASGPAEAGEATMSARTAAYLSSPSTSTQAGAPPVLPSYAGKATALRAWGKRHFWWVATAGLAGIIAVLAIVLVLSNRDRGREDAAEVPGPGPIPTPPPAIAPFDAKKAKEHQEAWARHLGVPVETTNSIGMKLVLIPPGEFDMGTSREEVDLLIQQVENSKVRRPEAEHFANEAPQHRVKISRPFYLGKYEVTGGQAHQITTGTASPQYESAEQPARKINWGNARQFCHRLSNLSEERAAGRSYRLPTEAEWEYACRAGSAGRWCFGDDGVSFEDYAWFGSNANNTTHPVGQKRPNAWGLHDMHGNVQEWCADWYAEDYYSRSSATDPAGPPTGTERVIRGGGIWVHPNKSRCAYRIGGNPWKHDPLPFFVLGFRVVCEIATTR